MLTNVLIYYKQGAAPIYATLPEIPRVGDEVKKLGEKSYKVHRVVWYLDCGYPRIYLYETGA